MKIEETENELLSLIKDALIEGNKKEFCENMAILFTNTTLDERIELSGKFYDTLMQYGRI